jgi:hypothetical protein
MVDLGPRPTALVRKRSGHPGKWKTLSRGGWRWRRCGLLQSAMLFGLELVSGYGQIDPTFGTAQATKSGAKAR